VKEVDRHLFLIVKSFGIDSCLYEIPKNDWVDEAVPPVTFSDVYCYLVVTPVDFIGEKLKAYNFVISGWVKSLQVLKRNSAYYSSDVYSTPSFVLKSDRPGAKPIN